jgi:hypothetical protein
VVQPNAAETWRVGHAAAMMALQRAAIAHAICARKMVTNIRVQVNRQCTVENISVAARQGLVHQQVHMSIHACPLRAEFSSKGESRGGSVRPKRKKALPAARRALQSQPVAAAAVACMPAIQLMAAARTVYTQYLAWPSKQKTGFYRLPITKVGPPAHPVRSHTLAHRVQNNAKLTPMGPS